MVSRREAERLIERGEVTVNGRVVDDPALAIDPERDRIEVRGRRVKLEAPLYRLLLKPRMCLSSLEEKSDAQGRKRASLARYVSDRALPWIVVGPLDYPSEGVLLLTTDGALAERISKQKNRLPMTYHVKFQGEVGEREIERLLRGFQVDGRPVKPSLVIPLARTEGKNYWVEMVVREFRPRALRVAGEVIRRRVLKISRTKFGDLSFEGLKMGGSRELNAREVAALQRAAGLR